MNPLKITAAATLAAALPLLRARGSGWNTVANAAGTWGGTKTFETESALPLAHTIMKFGTDPAKQADICGATDEPVGWTDSTSGDNASVGDDVSVALLGSSGKTGIAIASKAIAAGVDIFTAADGQVTDTAVTVSRRPG